MGRQSIYLSNHNCVFRMAALLIVVPECIKWLQFLLVLHQKQVSFVRVDAYVPLWKAQGVNELASNQCYGDHMAFMALTTRKTHSVKTVGTSFVRLPSTVSMYGHMSRSCGWPPWMHGCMDPWMHVCITI